MICFEQHSQILPVKKDPEFHLFNSCLSTSVVCCIRLKHSWTVEVQHFLNFTNIDFPWVKKMITSRSSNQFKLFPGSFEVTPSKQFISKHQKSAKHVLKAGPKLNFGSRTCDIHSQSVLYSTLQDFEAQLSHLVHGWLHSNLDKKVLSCSTHRLLLQIMLQVGYTMTAMPWSSCWGKWVRKRPKPDNAPAPRYVWFEDLGSHCEFQRDLPNLTSVTLSLFFTQG